MKYAIILFTIALTGCAAPQYSKVTAPASPQEQAMRDCKYDAAKATSSMMNGLEAGFQQGTLTRQCMEAKGYKRM